MSPEVVAYAGIGSQTISSEEADGIFRIAADLAKRGLVLYSGNAGGSDVTFQKGSRGKCVIMLPWSGFEAARYDPRQSLGAFDVGDTPEGNAAVRDHHPKPLSLSRGGKRLICRDYHQVAGYGQWPQVSLVVCCADKDPRGGVKGGTGQAVRIATSRGIPVVNIRGQHIDAVWDQIAALRGWTA